MSEAEIRPTESELEILQVIWERGPSTVRQVHDILKLKKEAGYTTTLKLMQIMEEKKGLLARKKKGKSHIYSVLVSRTDTQEGLLKKFVDTVFQGSATNLVMQALGNQQTSKEELEEIRDLLDKLEKNRKND